MKRGHLARAKPVVDVATFFSRDAPFLLNKRSMNEQEVDSHHSDPSRISPGRRRQATHGGIHGDSVTTKKRSTRLDERSRSTEHGSVALRVFFPCQMDGKEPLGLAWLESVRGLFLVKSGGVAEEQLSVANRMLIAAQSVRILESTRL